MSQENRRNIRSPVRLMAFVKNMKTSKVRRWLTKNISGTGVCLIADELLQRGERLELEVKLPDFPSPLVMAAEVVWTATANAAAKSHETSSVEIGILFIDPPAKIQSILNQYAAMNAPPHLD